MPAASRPRSDELPTGGRPQTQSERGRDEPDANSAPRRNLICRDRPKHHTHNSTTAPMTSFPVKADNSIRTGTRIAQQIDGSFGTAILAMILTTQLHAHAASGLSGQATAFGTAFWWSLGFTVIAIIPALALPHRHSDPTTTNTATPDRATARTLAQPSDAPRGSRTAARCAAPAPGDRGTRRSRAGPRSGRSARADDRSPPHAPVSQPYALSTQIGSARARPAPPGGRVTEASVGAELPTPGGTRGTWTGEECVCSSGLWARPG